MTMLFVITAIDKTGALSLRVASRQAHLDYLSGSDTVRLGGPFLDANGDMAGSLLIIEATDMDAARQWHAGDPYVKAGLFATLDIRPWKATIDRCGAGL
jgi:hypothetical protein